MKNISSISEIINAISHFSSIILKSPFLFLIVVILIYTILSKNKRESVNAEIVKLIKALWGRE